MSFNKISDKGVIKISKVLQRNATLKVFDISHNSLSDNGVLMFSSYLNEKSSLNQLRISWHDIHFDLNCTFVSVNMASKFYGNTGIILASTFLYHNITIQKLDISHNGLYDKGGVAIGESLKHNNTLQELNSHII